ncbi:HalOD1 output domain-containing protein [Halobacterium yunchengense]|uniref:HalOD1 output domain-containing protein n=1 Tax=Halobacterium yunchengense TaxID=3108497 RepID=UPI00300A0555
MENALGDVEGVQREYEWNDVEPTVPILETIAAFERGDPTETTGLLDAPLGAYVDLDALGALVRSETTRSITVEIEDYHVQIDGDTVAVTPRDR